MRFLSQSSVHYTCRGERTINAWRGPEVREATSSYRTHSSCLVGGARATRGTDSFRCVRCTMRRIGPSRYTNEIAEAAPHLARDLRSSVPRLHSHSPSDANKLRIRVEGGKGRALVFGMLAHAAGGGKKLITTREDVAPPTETAVSNSKMMVKASNVSKDETKWYDDCPKC